MYIDFILVLSYIIDDNIYIEIQCTVTVKINMNTFNTVCLTIINTSNLYGIWTRILKINFSVILKIL